MTVKTKEHEALEKAKASLTELIASRKRRAGFNDDGSDGRYARARVALALLDEAQKPDPLEEARVLLREQVRIASHGSECSSGDDLPEAERDEDGYSLDGCECGKFIIEAALAKLETL